jgi:hypothetical protein
MPTYSAIADATIAVNKPITNSLVTLLRDNPLAIFEALGLDPNSGVFTSAEQTITVGGTLTIPHGLTNTPLWIQTILVCKTTEYGYSANDEIFHPLNPHFPASGSAAHGATITIDGTNISVQVGTATPQINRRDGTAGNVVNITAANWRFKFRVWG